jgi:tripartite-type tricarboxylate transporter receptor subunit TctC
LNPKGEIPSTTTAAASSACRARRVAENLRGKARYLGVSGAQRSRFAPVVPTFAEQGDKDLV